MPKTKLIECAGALPFVVVDHYFFLISVLFFSWPETKLPIRTKNENYTRKPIWFGVRSIFLKQKMASEKFICVLPNKRHSPDEKKKRNIRQTIYVCHVFGQLMDGHKYSPRVRFSSLHIHFTTHTSEHTHANQTTFGTGSPNDICVKCSISFQIGRNNDDDKTSKHEIWNVWIQATYKISVHNFSHAIGQINSEPQNSFATKCWKFVFGRGFCFSNQNNLEINWLFCKLICLGMAKEHVYSEFTGNLFVIGSFPKWGLILSSDVAYSRPKIQKKKRKSFTPAQMGQHTRQC